MSADATDEPKTDQRGCPPGKAVVQQPHGGAIGQPRFVPTDADRTKVRALAKIFPPVAQRYISAQIIGPNGPISEDTLQRHFRMDMAIGRAELLTQIGTMLLKRALEGDDAPGVKGNHHVQLQIMARLGGWTGKMEVTGPGGGPIQTVDLSKLTEEQLKEYGRLAAIAEGIDPDSILIESTG